MKGTAINKLNYAGIVTLSQRIGSKKVIVAQEHNEGGASLFNFLADCLTGDFATASTMKPTKIMLLNKANQTIERVSGFIHLLTNPEKIYDKDEMACRVRYSFIIPNEFLENRNAFNAMGLYSSASNEEDFTNYAAICPISIEKNNISSSAILVADWELIIFNNEYDTKQEDYE